MHYYFFDFLRFFYMFVTNEWAKYYEMVINCFANSRNNLTIDNAIPIPND